jgi:hypothetical protein
MLTNDRFDININLFSITKYFIIIYDKMADINNVDELGIDNMCLQLYKQGDYDSLKNLVHTNQKIHNICQKYLMMIFLRLIAEYQMSGYNFFVKEQTRLMKETGITANMRQIINAWATLNSTQKQQWENRSIKSAINSIKKNLKDNDTLITIMGQFDVQRLRRICNYLTDHGKVSLRNYLMSIDERFAGICRTIIKH